MTSINGSTQNQVASGSGGIVPTLLFTSPVVNLPTVTAYTVPVTSSGTTYVLASIGAVITLPALATAKGCLWKFNMGANNATTAWTVTAPAGTLKGNIVQGISGAAATLVAVGTSVAFLVTAIAGDSLTISCDGTFFYVSGSGQAAASFAMA